MHEAGVRVHGTTREQPLALFELERPLLRRLPAVSPDLGTWHRVVLHRDCHVQHEHALYSAPFTLVGKTLWLRATDTTVSLHEDYRHVVTHLRAHKPGERMTVADHLPTAARAFFERGQQWCVRQAEAVGPRCAELVARLLSDRIAERLRAAQGVLACADATALRGWRRRAPGRSRTTRPTTEPSRPFSPAAPISSRWTSRTPAAYGSALSPGGTPAQNHHRSPLPVHTLHPHQP